MSTASIDLQGTPHPVIDTDPHPAANHLQDARAAIRTRVAYIREWGRWARDWADYIEEQHMDRVNARLDAILGISR